MTLQESNERIIELLVAGKTHKEIAVDLNMKKGTISRRIERLRKREDCLTVTQLVVKWLSGGINATAL